MKATKSFQTSSTGSVRQDKTHLAPSVILAIGSKFSPAKIQICVGKMPGIGKMPGTMENKHVSTASRVSIWRVQLGFTMI